MDFTIASRTDVGRIRTNNEDNFFIDRTVGLFIVCDGMGGHNAGEVASKMACDVIAREVENSQKLRDKYEQQGKPTDLKALQRALENAVSTACKEIFKQASRSPEQSGMGTTCTAVWLIGRNKGVLAHVGDSRLYLRRAGNVYQLSEDHTYVNELVKRGALTKEQARNHPQGNVLSRALGVQTSIAVDTMVFDVDAGDTLLLCSDGVYNYYPEAPEIGDKLSIQDLDVAIEAVINGALERGGHDNCTAIAIRIEGKLPSPESALAADRRIAILKQIRLFSYLSYNELVKVLGLTQLGRVSAGSLFISEGNAGDELFVVLAGEVEVIKGGAVISTLRSGAHLGEMALVDNAPRSASARARTDVNLLLMRREEFFNLIRSEPVIACKLLWSFVQALSGRLRETTEALGGARPPVAPGSDDDTFEVFVDEELRK